MCWGACWRSEEPSAGAPRFRTSCGRGRAVEQRLLGGGETDALGGGTRVHHPRQLPHGRRGVEVQAAHEALPVSGELKVGIIEVPAQPCVIWPSNEKLVHRGLR